MSQHQNGKTLLKKLHNCNLIHRMNVLLCIPEADGQCSVVRELYEVIYQLLRKRKDCLHLTAFNLLR